jgi:hypothetical protein
VGLWCSDLSARAICYCLGCDRNYIQYLHKHDKFGHPVYFEKIGKINIKQLQKSGTKRRGSFRICLWCTHHDL